MITHIYELATNQYKAKVADNKQFIPFTSIFPLRENVLSAR